MWLYEWCEKTNRNSNWILVSDWKRIWCGPVRDFCKQINDSSQSRLSKGIRISESWYQCSPDAMSALTRPFPLNNSIQGCSIYGIWSSIEQVSLSSTGKNSTKTTITPSRTITTINITPLKLLMTYKKYGNISHWSEKWKKFKALLTRDQHKTFVSTSLCMCFVLIIGKKNWRKCLPVLLFLHDSYHCYPLHCCHFAQLSDDVAVPFVLHWYYPYCCDVDRRLLLNFSHQLYRFVSHVRLRPMPLSRILVVWFVFFSFSF